eukprot:scaffold1782_cov77-Cylindrotheca_fusiformis.AAC.2
MVSSLLGVYNCLPRNFKAKLAEQVVNEIGKLGGRFLKIDSAGEWEEVSHVEAVEKVAKTFRNCRRYKNETEDVISVPT